MNLTKMQRSELKWLADQHELVWGGVYEKGGGPDLDDMERAGLIERVRGPYKVGKLTFEGGYRITQSGRAALSQEGE